MQLDLTEPIETLQEKLDLLKEKLDWLYTLKADDLPDGVTIESLLNDKRKTRNNINTYREAISMLEEK